MALNTVQKLKLKEGQTILTIEAPSSYKTSLGSLLPGLRIVRSGKIFDQVHWFVKTKAAMAKHLKKVLSLVKGHVICWIMYPKGTSGIQTDLNRDNGWAQLHKHDMQWINLVSFDDTWSAFGMREKTEADKNRTAGSKDRPVFQYVDTKTKTVTLPGDFAVALKKNKKQETFFQTLSFTNKKEYIEWIVSAKKESTRKDRVNSAIARLTKEWKNPANR